MPKWEYHIAVCKFNLDKNEDTNENFEASMNALGVDGWEIFQTSSTLNYPNQTVRYVCKRQVP